MPIGAAPLTPAARPLPRPGAGQIRVRVTACGVCHTDLHVVEGELPLSALPIVPGHQVVGTVDALGPGATGHALGDRVGVGWLHETCGVCSTCRHGRENLCETARFTGRDVDGGYAEYMVVPAGFAFPLPHRLTDAEAAPMMCAGIVGYRALCLCGISPGGRLGLYGFGASAHLVLQLARHRSCEVFVFTRSEAHRDLARRLGAAFAGGAEAEGPFKLDAAILFAPAGWLVPMALRHLRPGGTLAINAIHMSPIPELDYRLLYEERLIRSVTNYTRQDAQEFLALASLADICPEIERFRLEDANDVLGRLKRSELRAAAVLEP